MRSDVSNQVVCVVFETGLGCKKNKAFIDYDMFLLYK